MPELNAHEILKKQRAIKAKIEDVIPEYLDGDNKKNALEFVAYMRANKMQPAWLSANFWKAMCKGKSICYIRLPKGDMRSWLLPEETTNAWTVTPALNHLDAYEDSIIKEGLQSIIWENIYYCRNVLLGICNSHKCAPGKSGTILGKEFKNVCHHNQGLWFLNPDETTIDCIKKLLELEQKARTKK
jgi:hypothetical protein